MTEFDRGIAVAADGSARFDPAWWVQIGPNGGYVAAVLYEGLANLVADDTRPLRSLTVHYLRPGKAAAVQVDAHVERAGRTLTTVSGRLVQDGATIALGLAAFATPRARLEYDDGGFPDVPPPEELPEPGPVPGAPPIADRFDYRPALGSSPFSSAGLALIGAWVRLRDHRPVDAASLVLFADALPPAPWVRAATPFLATTVDYTVHLRQPSTYPTYDDWCLCVFRSRLAAEGFFEEDGEIWTRDGRLLAQSRQLAVMTPVPGGERSGRDE